MPRVLPSCQGQTGGNSFETAISLFSGSAAYELQSVNQKFFQSGNIGFVFQRWTMQKPGSSQPLDGSMNFRRAKAELACDNGDRRTPAWIAT